MTQFSGDRILHTENAKIETIFADNKQQKCIINSNLALFWLKLKKCVISLTVMKKVYIYMCANLQNV